MDLANQPGVPAAARPEVRTTAKTIAGGSIAEGIVGAGAVALAIIGLVGIYPLLMAEIATIAIGAALLLQGGAISSRIGQLIEADKLGEFNVSELGGGITAEFLAGLAGVTLGILALLGLSPVPLLAIAVIVFGGALVMSSGTTSRLNYLSVSRLENENARIMAREAVSAAGNLQLLIGIGAITLGILGLTDLPQLRFILIGLLAVGFSDLLSGSAISGRMMTIFRR